MVGVPVAIGGGRTREGLLAGGFATGLLLLAGFARAQLAHLSRRNAIGADADSLRADELVRHFDTFRFRLLVLGSPVVLALVAMSLAPNEGPFDVWFGFYLPPAMLGPAAELRQFMRHPRAKVLPRPAHR